LLPNLGILPFTVRIRAILSLRNRRIKTKYPVILNKTKLFQLRLY
jgi:hypothetical protein